MPASVTELIKEKLDIVAFLKGYLEVQPAGKNFKARCPFHNEKTPSFSISPERQSWHCFGCGLGGDVFTFVMKRENLDFPEALRLLAEKAGVELRRFNPAEERLIGVLYDLNEEAAKFFEDAYGSSDVAKKYLAERGISADSIKNFRIGWAPNQEEALNLHLLKKQFSPDDIIRAGLGIKTERGMQFDRFRGRIMFPIANHTGKVVGFTGRILPQYDTGKMGKYVNSPETPIYNKSKVLYGFSLAKDAIREVKQAVLVEGQMDVVMCHQAGITNSVAVSGTALTVDHLHSLRRVADGIVLAFDGDEAGWQATDRSFDLARREDFEVRIAVLPDAKDPAELAQKNPEGLKKAIADAPAAVKVYIEKLLTPGASYETRPQLLKLRLVLQKIARGPSVVEREHWLAALARYTNLSEHVLREELEQAREPVKENAASDVVAEEQHTAARKPATRWELVAERALVTGFHANRLTEIVADHIPGSHRATLTLLLEGKQQSGDANEDVVLRRIIFTAEEPTPGEFEELCAQLVQEYTRERRKQMSLLVKEAEGRGDEEALSEALAALSKLPGY